MLRVKLLFIPGAACGREVWVYQTRHFRDSEAVVLPGHPEGRPCSSVDEYVGWLRDYIHQHQCQDVILAGHSLGGAVVQLYGLTYPDEVKALVLIGTGARLRVNPDLLKAVEGMIINKVAWKNYLEDRYGLVAPEIRQKVIEERVRIGPAVMLSDLLCFDKFDILDRVNTIKLPTLAICGSEDELTPVKYTKYLVDKIEVATQVIIDGATHSVCLEKHKEVNQAIEKFLGRLHQAGK